jgi:FkbM family methyltransferase
MHFMRRYLRPGDAVLDIGANIGVYSLLAASCVGVSGHIVAFEPGLKAYQRLMENISLNQLNNITVHACAVGDQSGYIDFLADCDTTSRIRSKDDFDIPTIKVPVLRLDDVIKLDCALGKMDIEGAEPIALQGAQKLLKKANPPIWLLELNGSLRAFNFSEEVFVAWLTSQGYDICLYDADRLELNFTHFQPWLKSPNVFAVAHDRKQSIAERCGAYLIS